MSEQLYPKPPPPPGPDHSDRPWGVQFELVYDNGIFEWEQYYRTKAGAHISAWWKYHIASWGGSAVLFDNRKPCKDQNVNVCLAEGCFGQSCVKNRRSNAG